MTYDELFVTILSGTIFLILIHLGKGVPYGLDNNESFSSLNHARNFITYPFSYSMGLADETFSIDPLAHSFVHTHQGNFPRIFSTLIYYFGFENIEDQILLTTLIVGVLSIIVFYRFIKKEFSCSIALIAITFLLSDFYMFLQWQINTYRVWHMFFTSAMFYSASVYKISKHKGFLIIIFILSLFVFYGELLFAIFISTSTIIWFAFDKKNRLNQSLLLISSISFGAFIAVSIIIIQLVFLLGFNGFVEDLSSSFLARNYSNNNEDLLNSINRFHMENHIVFFHNYVDGMQYRNLKFLVDAFLKYSLSNYTVPLALIFTIFTINAAFNYIVTKNLLPKLMALLGNFPLFFILELFLLCRFSFQYNALSIIMFLVLSCACIFFETFLNNNSPTVIATKNLICILLLYIMWFYEIFLTNGLFGFTDINVITENNTRDLSIFTINLMVFISIMIISIKSRFSLNDLLRILSSIYVGQIISYFISIYIVVRLFQDPSYYLNFKFFSNKIYMFESLSRVLMFATGILGVTSIVLLNLNMKNKKFIIQHNRLFISFLRLFFSPIIALGFCILLLPGYAWSGYFSRNLSILIPFIALYVAIGLDWFRCAAFEIISNFRSKNFGKSAYYFSSLALFSLSMIYMWCSIQYNMYQLLFVDEFSNLFNFLKQLPNKSVVSNNYPAAYFLATKKWAYIGKANIIRQNVYFEKDNIWLADYSKNIDYNNPDLYVCLSDKNPSLYMMREISRAEKKEIPLTACENDLVIKNIISGNLADKYKVIAQDTSGNGFWSVVLLK